MKPLSFGFVVDPKVVPTKSNVIFTYLMIEPKFVVTVFENG